MNTPHRVLFVDDEPAILEGYRHALRRQPFEIHTCTSAAEALERMRHTSFDVVVSDQNMPGMNGSQFLGMVFRTYPDTVRIILTGQADLQTALLAINDAHAFRFLVKPVDSVDLALTVRSAAQMNELRRQSARLLTEVRARGAVLQELERSNPGITAVHRAEDGVIDLDSEEVPELDDLIESIRRELDPPAAGGAGGTRAA